MSDVFLSYASRDASIAAKLCSVLEENGAHVWIAPRDIIPGSDWPASISYAIANAKLMVLILSKNSNSSDQVKREIERAVSKGIKIIPFCIEKIDLSPTLEYLISTPQWLDAAGSPIDDCIARLSRAVSRLLESAKAPEADEPEPESAGRVSSGAARRLETRGAEPTESKADVEVAIDAEIDNVTAGDIAGVKGATPAKGQAIRVATRAKITNANIGDIVGIKGFSGREKP